MNEPGTSDICPNVFSSSGMKRKHDHEKTKSHCALSSLNKNLTKNTKRICFYHYIGEKILVYDNEANGRILFTTLDQDYVWWHKHKHILNSKSRFAFWCKNLETNYLWHFEHLFGILVAFKVKLKKPKATSLVCFLSQKLTIWKAKFSLH